MPLLGRAAMLLQFDVADAAITEHDDWHTHEHLPERLALPGFLRGTRWVATRGGPRYMVVYEVEDLATLSSPAYLARLDAPSRWTTAMMPHYRGMRRAFCSVAASVGFGTGHAARAWRYTTGDGGAPALRTWLVDDVLPLLPSTPGVGGAYLLEGAATPAMTREQRLRGRDEGVDVALVVTGYRADALEALDPGDAAPHGATAVADALYRLDYVLSAGEVVG
jgi:hypothetical protein